MAEQMVKVVFPNGTLGAMRPVIASRMVKKNQCVYAKDEKKEVKSKKVIFKAEAESMKKSVDKEDK